MKLTYLRGLALFLCLCALRVAASGPADQPPPTPDGSSAPEKTAASPRTTDALEDDPSAPDANASPQQSNPDRGFFANWFQRVAHTQAEQPHWITPVVTVTPRLEQEFRYDISQQTQPNGRTTLRNFGGAKGLEIIAAERIELIFSPPPYIVRSVNGVPDGSGDLSFLLKYRFFASNEEGGNYIFTAFLGGSLPTGSYTNGTKDANITPTLAAGKGWGNFDVTTTFGAIVPVDETNLIGRQIVWNTAFQYRVLRRMWPELEVNSTFFSGGPNDGKKQTFLTPGLVLGKFPIWRRLGFTVGGGLQTAATRFHTYNHKWILTVRFPF